MGGHSGALGLRYPLMLRSPSPKSVFRQEMPPPGHTEARGAASEWKQTFCRHTCFSALEESIFPFSFSGKVPLRTPSLVLAELGTDFILTGSALPTFRGTRVLLLICCVILGKSLNLSEPQLSQL